MRKVAWFVMLVCVVLLSAACPPRKADLVITQFGITGQRTVNADDSVNVPVAFTVSNQGGASAEVFKSAAEYTCATGTFVAPCTVPGQGSTWYPYTSGPLGPGNSVVFEGTVVIPLRGQNVSLVIVADSTSGDEFIPEYGRVNESNEMNNASSAIVVTLP